MKELNNLNFTIEEIKYILDINSNILHLTDSEIKENLNLLKRLNLNENEIKQIVYANPDYITRVYEDVEKLIMTFNKIGVKNIDLLIESNPYILSKYDFEITEYIEKKKKENYSQQEIIDIIESDCLIDE